jgi:hypothetical protein
MELTYRTEGDYMVPNLAMPEEVSVALGKYALLRKKYLKQHRPIQFANLLTSCTLNEDLMEIEQTANERMKLLTAQMAKEQGVDESLKSRDQMKWVGLTNSIRQRAEEVILNDLIYA